MLRKLMKHEFRATGRIMLPLYLVLLATAIGANFSTRGLMATRYRVLDVLGTLLIVAFTFAIFGVCIMSFVVMVQRFYRNLLQDEGYVMLTLPVSIHQQVWSKLIVSAVWFAVTVLAVILAACIMAFNVDAIKYFFQGLGELFAELRRLEAYYAVNGTALAVEMVVLCFLSCCAMCVQIYAALAIGHSFAGHKMAWSVAFFFGIQFVVQFLAGIGISVLDVLNIFDLLPAWHLSGMAAMHAALIVLIVGVVIYGAVFYGVTVYFLKRRLNLE